MKKARWLIAALAFVASLVLAGCELDTGAGPRGSSPGGSSPGGTSIGYTLSSSINSWTVSLPASASAIERASRA